MPEDTTLWIVTDTEDTITPEEITGRRSSTDRGGGFGIPGQVLEPSSQRKRIPLDARAIKAQMQGMIEIIDDLFDKASTKTGLQLNEVALSVEINAEGQVSLVGNGGKLGNKGGITLKFLRYP
ncbi:MAG: hypothetical protein AAF050_01970 [Cyanobacteria bacterium J06649_5]